VRNHTRAGIRISVLKASAMALASKNIFSRQLNGAGKYKTAIDRTRFLRD